ncbi:hypothetical protein B6N60_05065 [Richelia sinica FACHB-800]|uniref:Orc1-like AAA ATPase domain-containing protein n=1 Tax=Richelia sinica FACHB-800 TaxID=1357546 RepID=A0A975TD03_9NOST|nr:hypothetical protein [Richelia sinica]MBD2663938.1 hypothetical protein [Richelia sinica FACHB-800]QXE26334.1 hypothetical protein B6N60_05065 [Richelia sinica FACHB-800]
MTNNTSSIDELLKSHNPFAGHMVVRPQQIWGKSFPDVPSINSHASNAVFDALEKINQGQYQTVGITITAEKGLGKSHIISRIRHRLQPQDNYVFIYMGKYDNLNQIKYEFLQNVASSLRAFGKQNVMQIQEIAASLINEAIQRKYSPQQYISDIYPKWLRERSNKFIGQLTQAILKHKPEIPNPYIVKAILWTLSSDHVNYASYWLSGLELSQTYTNAMGLPNIKSNDKEIVSMNIARQLLDITNYYKIPVICFDELDDGNISDFGLTTAQVIATLVKDLYQSIKRGVLLLAMYPDTWNQQIRVLPQAEAVIDRLVSEQPDRQPIALKYLNSDDIVNLVKTWLQDFYQENQQTPPHPLYPFDAGKLKVLGKSKPTVRSVLKWCADNFIDEKIPNPDPPIVEIKIYSVKPYYQSELVHTQAYIDSLIEDESIIAQSLKFAFERLIGKTIEGVTIEKIEEIPNQKHIDFKIVGNQQQIKIGVDVVQIAGGVGITTALRKLIDYQTFDLTRGCLVRSKTIAASATLARENLRRLLKEKGGEWVSLQSQDIKPLIAIWFVWNHREIYELTDDEIFGFIEQQQIAINNPLIREILSDPSGQEPDNLTDEDLPMRIPQSVVNNRVIELNL